MFWIGLGTHKPPHSLLITMLTRLVSRCGRRRDSLLFYEGRPISAKSVCLRRSSFPHCSAPRNRRNSLVPAMCRRCGKFVSVAILPTNSASPSSAATPPPGGIPHPSCGKTLSKDGAEGRRRDEGRIHFVSKLLRACGDKALLIFGGRKKNTPGRAGLRFLSHCVSLEVDLVTKKKQKTGNNS